MEAPGSALPVVILLFGIAAAVAVAVLSWQAKQRRQQEWQAVSAAHGLQSGAGDAAGVLRSDFRLLRKGDGRGVDMSAWGLWRDVPVWVFEYWYYDEHRSTDGNGMTSTSRSYQRFTCVIAQIPIVAPRTSIEPESALTRLADHVGMRDIEFESEDFNRRYNVTSDDRKFASYLIDARMMEWLMGAPGWRFELAGNRMLCWTKRMPPSAMPRILAAIEGFIKAVPRVAIDTYGAAR